MPALHIGVQAVLALYASWAAAERRDTVRAPRGAGQCGCPPVRASQRHPSAVCYGAAARPRHAPARALRPASPPPAGARRAADGRGGGQRRRLHPRHPCGGRLCHRVGHPQRAAGGAGRHAARAAAAEVGAGRRRRRGAGAPGSARVPAHARAAGRQRPDVLARARQPSALLAGRWPGRLTARVHTNTRAHSLAQGARRAGAARPVARGGPQDQGAVLLRVRRWAAGIGPGLRRLGMAAVRLGWARPDHLQPPAWRSLSPTRQAQPHAQPCHAPCGALLGADPEREGGKLAADPARYTRRYEGVSRGGAPWAVDVLAERFLGPEIFFQPQLYAGNHTGARAGMRMFACGLAAGYAEGLREGSSGQWGCAAAAAARNPCIKGVCLAYPPIPVPARLRRLAHAAARGGRPSGAGGLAVGSDCSVGRVSRTAGGLPAVAWLCARRERSHRLLAWQARLASPLPCSPAPPKLPPRPAPLTAAARCTATSACRAGPPC